MRKNIKRSAVVGTTVAAVFGVGIGFAAWTNYGEGSGAVTAGQAAQMTVNVSGVTGLFPTGTKNVTFTVTNTNPYQVQLNNAELKTVTLVTGGSQCDPAVVTGTSVDLSAVPVLAPSATSAPQTFPVTMSNLAHDDCQGAEFNVTLRVTGLSS